MRKVIQTSNAPIPKTPYSQAIVTGDLVFVAGQACVNPKTGEFDYGDIKSETRRTLENIRAILEASGSSMKDVVRVGVFLAGNMDDFAGMNEVYKEFFPENPPARTTVGVQIRKIKVEIDCVACLSNGKRDK